MKIKFILSFSCYLLSNSYILGNSPDSVSFKPPLKGIIKTTDNKQRTILDNDPSFKASEKYLYINEECNFPIPSYDQLTGHGNFLFKRIQTDALLSLKALNSNFSFDKKSQYFIFYFTRTKTFNCKNQGKITFGVGVYVVLKVSELKSNIILNSVYDISAAAQLSLAKVEMEVRTYGFSPSLQNEFIPESISKIDINTAGYFDKIVSTVRTKIDEKNTKPDILPTE
jgi:hypothetical protein